MRKALISLTDKFCGQVVPISTLQGRTHQNTLTAIVSLKLLPIMELSPYRFLVLGARPLSNTFVYFYNYYRRLLEEKLRGVYSKKYAIRCKSVNGLGGSTVCVYFGRVLERVCGAEIFETRKGKKYVVPRDCRLPPVEEFLRQNTQFNGDYELLASRCPEAARIVQKPASNLCIV
ncbi:MAG: hypothetical protein QXT27_01750 [Pyrobaculum sp.]